MSRIDTKMRVARSLFRAIGTESGQTRHRFAGIVLGEGGGTTPRPWVGDRSASASRDLDGEDRA